MIKKLKNGRDSQSVVRLFPNMVTILGLCAGLSSIRFALLEKWEMAVTFVVLAAFIDMMDGRLARILKSTSEFGAELDSLADFLNFGVAPPLILYLWATNEVKGWGWALVLFFAICAVIRLARFNTDLDTDMPSWSDKYFVGIPAPGGALLALWPMALTFEFAGDFVSVFTVGEENYLPICVIIYAALLAFGMASKMPTLSLKRITFRREYSSYILVIAGLLFISLILEFWMTLSVIAVIYYLSLPIGLYSFYKARKKV